MVPSSGSARAQARIDAGPTGVALAEDGACWTELCACALALAVVWLTFRAATALGLTVERVELVTYLAVGVALPGALFFLLRAVRARRAAWLDWSALVLCTVVALTTVVRYWSWLLLAATLFSAAWVLVLTRSADEAPWRRAVERAITTLAALLIGWILAARLMWWTSFDAFAHAPGTLAVLSAATSLSAFGLFARTSPSASGRGRSTGVLHWIALAVFVLLAFRSDHIQAAAREPALDVLGHTYSIVGPVELVRDGGWLLWDVASNYGFVNVWLVAALPIASAWKALYGFDAALVAACALATYWVSRFERRSLGHTLFAFVVTVTAVFYAAGNVEYLRGPESYPMVGPFRFLWVYVLVGHLYFEARSAVPRAKRGVWLTGTAAWVTSCLWSPESLLFGSVVWLPAYCLLVARDAPPNARARFLLLPPAALAIVVAIVSCVYWVGLGHPPDYASYFEFVLAADTSALPVDPAGGFWIYLLWFALLLVVVWRAVEERDDSHLPVLVGCAGAVWAVFAYFVPRSHENNLLNLLAPSWFALAITCKTARERTGTMPLALGCLLLPVLAVAMTIVFGRPEMLADNLRGLRLAYVDPASGPDDRIERILALAGVRDGDAVAFVGTQVPSVTHQDATGRLVRYAHALAPIQPFVNFKSLGPEAQATKVARFVTRTQRSGWLIAPTWVSPATVHQMFDPYYDFDATRRFQESGLRIVWLSYRGSEAKDR